MSKITHGLLPQALQELNAEWSNTKNYWHDLKSQQFEADYLEKLPALLAKANTVMIELDNLLRKVTKDCE